MGRKSHDIRMFRRIVGVQSTEQSVLSLLTFTSFIMIYDSKAGTQQCVSALCYNVGVISIAALEMICGYFIMTGLNLMVKIAEMQ